MFLPSKTITMVTCCKKGDALPADGDYMDIQMSNHGKKTVSECNKLAISMLSRMRLDDAVQIWRKAIQSMHTTVEEKIKHDATASCYSSANTCAVPVIVFDCIRICDDTLDASKLMASVSSDGFIHNHQMLSSKSLINDSVHTSYGYFYLFGQVFDLRDDLHYLLSNDRHTIMSAILFYNIGLAHHLQYITCAVEPTNLSTSVSLARKSLNYYYMSLQLIYSLPENMIVNYHIGTLLLASANNLGCIHSAFHHHVEIQKCREIMQLYFPTFMTSIQHQSLYTAWPQHGAADELVDIIAFFSFSILMLKQNVISAPSA
jgi:hypothetical protein